MERMHASNRFQDLCRVGSLAGIHLIGWWLKADSFQEHIGYGGQSGFDVKAAYGLDTQSARRFFDDPLLEWMPKDNRMMVWDSAEMARPVRVIPYRTFNEVEGSRAE